MSTKSALYKNLLTDIENIIDGSVPTFTNLGNITALLSKVKPAIANVQERDGNVELEDVTKANVHQSIKEIRDKNKIMYLETLR